MTTLTPELGYSTADQLSFVTQKRGMGGTIKQSNYFDVPDETFSHGVVTGTLAALELLDAVKRSRSSAISGGAWVVSQVLAEAFVASQEGKTEAGWAYKPSRRGAAYGFLEIVESAFMFLAQNGRYQEFVSGKVAAAERIVDAEKAENKTRTARAIAARKAKRLTAKIGGAA